VTELAIPQGVGWTALVVAAQRGAESRREDALFHDPLAEALRDLVGDGPGPDTPGLRTDTDGELTPMTRVMGDYLPLRTRWFDDVLVDATATGIDQVVVLAAGLDARPFRLAWPADTRIFEVDTAEVLTFKDEVVAAAGVAPTAERLAVAADLREDWPSALRAAGFDPARPTVWLAEGLLISLPAAGAEDLLGRLTELSAPGSRMATEYAAADPGDSMDATLAEDDPGLELFRELVDEGPPAPPREWFAAYGWGARVATLADAARVVGRPAPPVMDDEQGGMTSWLVDARR
jgi:methyltransferase (TIGR00027 family)